MDKAIRILAGIFFAVGMFLIIGSIGSADYATQNNQLPDKNGNKMMAAGLVMLIPVIYYTMIDKKVDESMKEKDFEKQVKEFLKEKGCWELKTWSNGIQRKGVPDLLVCCNGYFLGIELKQEHGTPTKLQLWNMRNIRNSNGICIVLYPNQFDLFKVMIEQLLSDNSADEHWKWHMHQMKFDTKFYKRKENKKDESV